MQNMDSTLGALVKRSLNEERMDYIGEDGFRYCGKCHTRKECLIQAPELCGVLGGEIRVGVMCRCQEERQAAEEAERRWQEFEVKMKRLRRDGITDPTYWGLTFDQDDRRDPQISTTCQRYVKNWREMRENNIGILFYGDVGTGKSFLACCIANALLNELVSVSVTNLPKLLNRLQSGYGDDRQDMIDRLQRYSLLVLDDLGVERDTPYAMEQVFNIIDTRARAGKPLIVTTNLSLEELKNARDITYRRVYDRVLEMCPVQLKLKGKSRREDKAEMRRENARRILSGRAED